LTAFDWVQGPTTIGTATGQSSGNDGLIAWGRWTGGVSAGAFGADFTRGGAMHYIAGLPATNMPTTGVATYQMIGATTPTLSGAATSASINSSSIVVDFSLSSADFTMDFTLNGQPFSSGLVSLVRSGAQLSASSVASMELQGFLAGDGAARAGMAYRLDTVQFLDLNGSVSGAIAYSRGDLSLSPTRQLLLLTDTIAP
jgi:hypothetical protein